MTKDSTPKGNLQSLPNEANKPGEFPWRFIATLVFTYAMAKLFHTPISNRLGNVTKIQCPLPGGKELLIELADPLQDAKAVNEQPAIKHNSKATKSRPNKRKKNS